VGASAADVANRALCLYQLEEIGEGTYMMDARVPISEANEVLEASFSDRESHTIGGLVTARLRRIPKYGDSIEETGFRIAVEDTNERAATRRKVEPMWGLVQP
jgi:putative hemolysin